MTTGIWWLIGAGLLLASIVTIGVVFWRGLKKSGSTTTSATPPTPAGTRTPTPAPAPTPTATKTKDNLCCTVVLVAMVLGLAWVTVTGIKSIEQAVSRSVSAPTPVVAQEAKQEEIFTIPARETVKVSLRSGFRHWEIEAQAPDEDARWEIHYQQISFFKGTTNLCFKGGGPSYKNQRGPALTTRHLELQNLE